MNNFQISVQIFLQLSIILTSIKILGYLGQRFLGQPQVVCEMITGVVLGPSILGHFWPDLFEKLFPPQSITPIYVMAQIGLVLYMFIIGTEFRIDIIQKRLKTALSVSAAGIIAPMLLAGILAVFIFDSEIYFKAGTPLYQRWLFIGSAISITAFPMLARIIHECRIANTPLGAISLAAGSLDDVTAWCLLAIVVAVFSNDMVIALTAVGGGIVYAFLMLFVFKNIFQKINDNQVYKRDHKLPYTPAESFFGFVVIGLMLVSYITDALGIYSVFGAFILGIALPRGRLTQIVQEKIEPLAVYLFLPLFFIYSGLNTKIDLLLQGNGFNALIIVLILSICGKFIACSISAKLGGESTRDSICIGALMNARGLMELILLNIGYERGIISQNLYTIFVIMAIVTTLMATPIFILLKDKNLVMDEK